MNRRYIKAPDMSEFAAARREAMRSWDEEQIRTFGSTWGSAFHRLGRTPEAVAVLWAAIHKARTALLDLNRAERYFSAHWLIARGMQPFWAVNRDWGEYVVWAESEESEMYRVAAESEEWLAMVKELRFD